MSKRKRNNETDLDKEQIYQRYIIPYVSQNFSEVYEKNGASPSEKTYDKQLGVLENFVEASK